MAKQSNNSIYQPKTKGKGKAKKKLNKRENKKIYSKQGR